MTQCGVKSSHPHSCLRRQCQWMLVTLGQVPGTWLLPELFQLPWIWWNSHLVLARSLAEKHFSKICRTKMDDIFYFSYFSKFILRIFKPKGKWMSPPQQRYFLSDPLRIFIFALFISSPAYIDLTVWKVNFKQWVLHLWIFSMNLRNKDILL